MKSKLYYNVEAAEADAACRSSNLSVDAFLNSLSYSHAIIFTSQVFFNSSSLVQGSESHLNEERRDLTAMALEQQRISALILWLQTRV